MPRSAASSPAPRGKRLVKETNDVGRPKKDGPLREYRKDILFDVNEWTEVADKLGPLGDREVGPRLRDILLKYSRGEIVERAPLEALLRADYDAKMVTLGTDAFRAPVLSSVPCGPWDKAVETAPTFAISRDTARLLEALPGDVWIRAQGESMLGAGIASGVLTLVRRYGLNLPRLGDIVVIQITRSDGEVEGTMKRFNGTDARGVPKLLDGNDQPFALPPQTQKVDYIARALAVLGRV